MTRALLPFHLLLIALAYYLSGRAGLYLASYADQVSLIWPPTGIAMFALLAWGVRMWPAVFLAAFFINLPLDTSILASLAIAAGNTLGPVLAVLALKYLRFNLTFSRTRDTLLYVGIGGLAGMAVNASVGASSLVLDGVVPVAAMHNIWLTWWLGDALGVLIIGPPLLGLLAKPSAPSSSNAMLESMLAWAGLLLGGVLCLTPLSPFSMGLQPMLTFPFVIWLALRLHNVQAAWAVVVLSAMALWGVFAGTGPFINHLDEPDTTWLWTYMFVTVVTTMLVVSLRNESVNAFNAVQENEDRLKVAQKIAHIGHWELDYISNELTWSDEVYRLFEIDPERFGASYEAFLDAIHPDDRDMVSQAFTGSVSTRTPYDINHRLKMKDGRIKFVNERCSTTYNDEGKPIRSVGTVQDITDRVLVEDALRRSSREWTMAMDAFDDAIYLLDAERHLVRANKAFYGFIGLSPEQAVGRHIVELIHPEGEAVPCPVCRAQEAKQDVVITMEADHPDNPTPVPIEVRVKIVRDEGGEATGILMGIHDLSHSRKLDAALLESELKFRGLVESSSDWIWAMDKDGTYTYASPALENLLGYSPDSVLGKTPYDLMSLEETRQVRQELDSLISERKNIEQLEVTHTHKDGHLVVMETSGTPIFDASGEFSGYIGIDRDITERKQAEAALKESENYLQWILSNLPAAVVVHDATSVIQYCNDSALKILGLTLNQAMGKDAFDPAWHFIRDDGTTMLFEEYPANRVISTKKPIRNLTVGVIRHADEEPAWVLVDAFPDIDTDGQLKQVIVSFIDVTERRRMERLMVQTEKMMSVGGLAAGMAHELNNPLGGILQGIQNVQRRISPDRSQNMEVAGELGLDLAVVKQYFDQREITGFLQGIGEAGERAAVIVQNMLQFSRKADSELHPESINTLIDQALELANVDYDLKKKYDFRKNKIIREYDPALAPVMCIASEIQQVLLNLFRNAAQALTEQKDSIETPSITIRTYSQAGMTCVEVEDNGPGMDEETCSHVFEPFFTTRRVGEGTGLGLSVSYFIVTQEHNGKLTVDSQPGQGATFRICLPK